MFFFTLTWGAVLYIILFLLAPIIADFYDDKQLVLMIRVMGLLLPISSYNAIQQAYISREMLFRHLFKATFLSSLFSGVIGIILALLGFGVWSLVAQYMLSVLINTGCVFVFVRWRPIGEFSLNRLKKMLPFGGKLLLEKVIQNCYIEVTALLLGRVYTSRDLAFYNKAQQFPRLAVTNLSDSIGAVLFSAMSRMEGNKNELRRCMAKYLRYVMFVLIPVLIGLMAISRNLIMFLLSEKWIECVPLLCVFCIYYLFEPVHALNSQVYKALGKGNIIVILQLLRAILNVIVLIITIKISPFVIAIGATLVNIIYWVIVSWKNESYIGYGFWRQAVDLMKISLSSIVMGVVMIHLSSITQYLLLNIIIQCSVGVLLYFIICAVLRIEELSVVTNIIRQKVIKK